MPTPDFERDVVDRLARIETWSRANYRALREQTVDNERRFEKIEGDVEDVVVDQKVAARTARVWGSAAGAALVALAEAARAWFVGS